MTLPENQLAWAVKAFRDDRASSYATYRRYLEGNQPMAYATQKFRQAFGNLFSTFAYNRCSTVVDAHADRMRVAGFGADDTDADDATAQAAQDLWDRNHMDIHEGQLAIESFGLGDSYLIVEVHPDTGDVQMWPQTADQVRVHYDEDRPGVIDLAAKMWTDEDERVRLTLYFTDRIEKYRTTNKWRAGVPNSDKQFERYQPDGDTEWPIKLKVDDTVPVFHFPNNARINEYGVSELRDVLGLQDALNKSLMDQLVASEFAAAPQRVILGYDATDPESQQAMQNLVTGLTQMLAIPADPEGRVPSIAEFTSADMKQYDLVAEKWDIRISRVSKVPVHYLTQTGIAASGRALRIAEAPFVAKLTDRQQALGPIYSAALAYGLQLEGKQVMPGDVRVNWEPAAPMSEEDKWDIAAQKANAGMPSMMILRELGYDPDELKTIMEEQKAERGAALMEFGSFEAPTPDAARRDEDEGAA